jgi:type I restriction enzyme S subunit
MKGEKTIQLRDVCVKIGSGATPRGGKEAYRGGATSLIRSQNIYNEGFHRDGLVYIDDDQAAELRNVEVKPNDVLLNITGDSVARCCQVATDVLPARVNQHVAIIRPDPKCLDARFLRYVLVSHDYQSRMLALASAGATRPALTKSMIEELDIPSPPLPEQRAIASVLGALDDKIELNRRMNATLEAMARALFQSWFVDFDPVRAKLDGRQPEGMDAETAALFPDSFQDSELGHIPKGWTVRPLTSLACYLSRGIGPSYLEHGGVCVLNQKCVRDHRVDFTKSRRHDAVKKPINDRALMLYDILVNSTGMGTLGRVAQVFHLPEVAIVDSHVTIVRPASDTDPFFLGINLTGREAEIEELGEGSTGQTELSRTRLGEMKVIAPPFDLQKAFGAAVGPLLKRINENETQSRTLATLRDTLLPRLLSGELSVQVWTAKV